jgi:hypothetical protein
MRDDKQRLDTLLNYILERCQQVNASQALDSIEATVRAYQHKRAVKVAVNYELLEAKSEGGWYVMHNSSDGKYWVPVSKLLPKAEAERLLEYLLS